MDIEIDYTYDSWLVCDHNVQKNIAVAVPKVNGKSQGISYFNKRISIAEVSAYRDGIFKMPYFIDMSSDDSDYIMYGFDEIDTIFKEIEYETNNIVGATPTEVCEPETTVTT